VIGALSESRRAGQRRFTALPKSIILTFDTPREVAGLSYQPRQDQNTNGHIPQYRVLVSADRTDFTDFTEVATGQWPLDAATKQIDFDPVADAVAVRLEAVEVAAPTPPRPR
jgi:hypothetical protein